MTPGWYADPWRFGWVRWWDGYAWSGHVMPAATPGVPVDPVEALESERRAARWARIAVVAMPALYVLQTAVFALVVLPEFFDGSLFQTPADGQPVAFDFPGWWFAAQLGSLLVYGGLAAMAVWSMRSARLAAALGYPARHTPGWAAGGWFCPVVNLWFPYQAIVDCLRPASPARRRVLPWWLCQAIGTGAAGTLTFPLAFVSYAAGIVGVAVTAVVALITGVLGLRVVRAVEDDHAQAVVAPL